MLKYDSLIYKEILHIHVDRYSKYRAMRIHMIPHTLEYRAMIVLVIIIMIVLWESIPHTRAMGIHTQKYHAMIVLWESIRFLIQPVPDLKIRLMYHRSQVHRAQPMSPSVSA
jgi:hypothetical protein